MNEPGHPAEHSEIRARQQAAIARLGRRALLGEEIQLLLDEAAAIISDMLRVDIAGVLELLPDGTEFLLRAGVGLPPGFLGRVRLPVRETQAGLTIARYAPVIVEDLAADPRFPGSKALRELGASSGVTVVIRGRDRPFGVLGAHTLAPRRFTENDVYFLRGIANVLAGAIQRSQAEAALREARDELQALIEASPAPIVAYDPDGVVTLWNPAAERVFGWTREEAMGAFLPIVPDDSLEEFHSIKAQALAGRSFSNVVAKRRRKDGSIIDVSFSNAGVRNSDGRIRQVVAVIVDITDRKRAEEAAWQSEERLRLALEASQMGTWEWNVGSGEVWWSDNLEPMHGLAPGTFRGTYEAFVELVVPDDRELVTAAVERAVRDGTDYDIEFRIRWPDGSVRWISGLGHVFRDERGAPIRMLGLGHDVTERKRREEALGFLAEASETLASTLEYERTLGDVARLAVPRLADCCVIEVTGPDDAPRPLTVVHVDSEKEELVRDLQRRYPGDPGSRASLVGRLSEPHRLWWAGRVDEGTLREIARDAEHLADLRRLELSSILVVPLAAHGRSLGAITLLSSGSGRHFSAEDAALAQDLARHAALSVDNARLYQQQSEIAETLQQSLLPARLPEVPRFELAALYQPAGLGIDVGGDFYDAFELEEGRLAAIVGDVCGRGPAAAALTGLARHTLRGSALHDVSPSAHLANLNEAIFRQVEETTFCTAVYVRLEPVATGATLTLSCGGHPRPLVVTSAGKVEPLDCHGSLIGAFADPVLTDEVAELGFEDTLVIYTDGLVEALDGHGAERAGANPLAELLEACARLSAQEIVDRMGLELAAEGRRKARDDVAVLVVRIVSGDGG